MKKNYVIKKEKVKKIQIKYKNRYEILAIYINLLYDINIKNMSNKGDKNARKS